MKFWKLFAICPFWQRNRKTASTAPRSNPYHEPAPPHGATSTPFHGTERIPPHGATPAPFHNTAPVPIHGAEHVSTHGDVPVPFHSDQPAPSYEAAASLPCPGTAQEPHHGGKAHPPTAPRDGSNSCRSTTLQHCAETAPSHSSVPGPSRPRHCSRADGNPKTKNWPVLQLFCDYGLPKNPQSRIKAQKCGKNGSSTLFGDRKESAIAKKLQKSRDFCFRNELLPPNRRRIPLKRPNAGTDEILR